MSRSTQTSDIQITVKDKAWQKEKRRNWIGYNRTADSIQFERQNYLTTEWMFVLSPACVDDLGDNKFSRYDMDWDVDDNDKH